MNIAERIIKKIYISMEQIAFRNKGLQNIFLVLLFFIFVIWGLIWFNISKYKYEGVGKV
jgi:hypothetical protein